MSLDKNIITPDVAKSVYLEMKKDSKTRVIESPYSNADLVQSGDRFAVLDHDRQEITYYMEYRERDLKGFKALYQSMVWKSWLVNDKGIPQKVLWKCLFPAHGIVTTDNIETDLGTGFWHHVVIDALQAGKCVYFLDSNSNEGLRPIKTHGDLHIVHKSIWNKGDRNRLRFVLISERSLCLEPSCW